MTTYQADELIQETEYAELIEDYEEWMGDHLYFLENGDCVAVTGDGCILYIEQ